MEPPPGSWTFSTQVCFTLSRAEKQIEVRGTVALILVGALSSSNLEQVIVDCSHIDEKRRGILDMRETQQPLMALLNRAELKSRYGCGTSKVRLLFY